MAFRSTVLAAPVYYHCRALRYSSYITSTWSHRCGCCSCSLASQRALSQCMDKRYGLHHYSVQWDLHFAALLGRPAWTAVSPHTLHSSTHTPWATDTHINCLSCCCCCMYAANTGCTGQQGLHTLPGTGRSGRDYGALTQSHTDYPGTHKQGRTFDKFLQGWLQMVSPLLTIRVGRITTPPACGCIHAVQCMQGWVDLLSTVTHTAVSQAVLSIWTISCRLSRSS